MAYMKKYAFVVAALALLVSGCCNKENCSNENTKEETTMNTTMQDLLTRRSIRSYTDEVPPREVIEEICKAGTYAPTGMNRQAPIIIAVTNRVVRDRLSKLNGAVFGPDNDRDPFYGAPVVALVFANRDRATCIEDGALVTGNILNAAYALGVDSCYIFRAKESFETDEGRALARSWGVPDSYIGVGTAILGYRSGDYPAPKPRKDGFIIKV